jgi:hemerythrin superfamily protein
MLDNGTTAPPDCVTLLGLDHRRLDAILADAKRWLATGDLQRAYARFSAFRHGLEHHIVAEEEILFPTFEALTGASGGGPTHVMRMEHAEIRWLMAEVASNLERGGDEGHTTPLAALTARVYAHNRKEERILYPATDQATRDARRAGGTDAPAPGVLTLAGPRGQSADETLRTRTTPRVSSETRT